MLHKATNQYCCQDWGYTGLGKVNIVAIEASVDVWILAAVTSISPNGIISSVGNPLNIVLSCMVTGSLVD